MHLCLVHDTPNAMLLELENWEPHLMWAPVDYSSEDGPQGINCTYPLPPFHPSFLEAVTVALGMADS